jgi:UDP-glucose 4-epimerase
MLSQAARLAGRPAVPVPPALSGVANTLFRRTGLTDFSPDQIRFLSFGRALDTTRMRRDLGLEPRYTTREAFLDFVHGRRLHGPLSPDVVDSAQERVLGAVRALVPSGEAS